MRSRSPLVLVIVLLAVLGVVLIWPSGHHERATDRGAATRTGSPPAPTPSPPRRSSVSSPADPVDPAQAAAARRTVRGFALAYTRDLPHLRWLGGLTSYVSPELRAGFSYTAKWRQPTGRLRGTVQRKITLTQAVFTLHYTAGLSVTCQLRYSAHRWLVTGVTPAAVATAFPSAAAPGEAA